MTYTIIALLVAALCCGGAYCIQGGSGRTRSAIVGFFAGLGLSLPVVFLLLFFRVLNHSIQIFGVAVGESLWMPAACAIVGAVIGGAKLRKKKSSEP